MKKLYFLFTFLMVAQCVHAQWFILNSGVTTKLNSVFCISDSNVFVAGDNGLILQTLDGGSTWLPRNSGTTQKLRSVQFPTAQTGYATGDSGTIVKTTDGGLTWALQNSHSLEQLNSIFFTNKDTGYVVGDDMGIDPGFYRTYMRTKDGGLNWNIDSSFTACCISFKSVIFSDKNIGYILGYDMKGTRILYTTNSGNTWSGWGDPDANASNNWWPTNAMAVRETFPGSMEVLVGNAGSVRHINNVSGYSNVFGSFLTDTLNAVCDNFSNFTAVGRNGRIGLYPNSGPPYCFQTSGVTDDLNAIMFYNASIGYIAGDNGRILKTINAGLSVSVNELSAAQGFSFYPNPFSESTTFSTKDNLKNATLTVYNSLGQQVKQLKNISGTTFTLQRGDLQSGPYFISLTQNNTIIISGKLIITD